MGRESARRNTCINNQKQIGIAINTYVSANKGLPGALEQPGANYAPRSWVVSLLAQLGEPKRYEFLTRPIKADPGSSEQILDYSVGGEVEQAIVGLPVIICPTMKLLRSDNTHQNTAPNTSYVVNCGPCEDPGITGAIAAQFTLFKDRRKGITPTPTKVEPSEIKDGSSNTVFLSENVQAGSWYPSLSMYTEGSGWSVTSPPTAPDELDSTRSVNVTAYIGFIWCNDSPHDRPANFVEAPAQATTRPSSNHPGTIVMLYGDGSVKPMNDDVDPKVYLSAVCPDDAKARKAIGLWDGIL
ncbi:MAG: DUF1559 domain-containing protein [Planctomycetaceae bacterium]|nr:DUF1559 domain-containing protein [Planctomycetaceae bacterium]